MINIFIVLVKQSKMCLFMLVDHLRFSSNSPALTQAPERIMCTQSSSNTNSGYSWKGAHTGFLSVPEIRRKL